MTKSVKFITGFLGVSLFMSGILKFVNPVKEWYRIQVMASELPFPEISYWTGQLTEIAVGLGFLFLLFKHKNLTRNTFNRIFYTGNILITAMMLAAFYVHLHPNVPSDVLPLKIRLPYIPGFFLLLSILNMYQGKETSAHNN